MDKAQLNNEIVRCRPLIKRARVCTIRKKIKKLQILKSCKKEEQRDKKNRKAERLLEEILLLKKVREDDVTKFALQQNDLNDILHKTTANEHEHVYAVLAMFPDVQKRLNAIKTSIPDPKQLTKLLEVLGTRSVKKKKSKVVKGDPHDSNEEANYSSSGEGNSTRKTKVKRKLKETTVKNKNVDPDESEESSQEVTPDKLKFRKNLKISKTPGVVNHSTSKQKKEKNSDPDAFQTRRGKEYIEEVGSTELDTKSEVEADKKVDDPFFISKKVAVPKLILDELKENPQKEIKFSRDDVPPKFRSRQKSFPNNYPAAERRSDDIKPTKGKPIETPVVEEKLHPSWAAKKVKLIQPFQGKKIKFDD